MMPINCANVFVVGVGSVAVFISLCVLARACWPFLLRVVCIMTYSHRFQAHNHVPSHDGFVPVDGPPVLVRVITCFHVHASYSICGLILKPTSISCSWSSLCVFM